MRQPSRQSRSAASSVKKVGGTESCSSPTDSCKFPTYDIMGAYNFKFAPKFPRNWMIFNPKFSIFLDENISTRRESSVVTSVSENYIHAVIHVGLAIIFTRDSSSSRYCLAPISYGNSVCLSVYLSRTGTESSPGEIETPGLHHMIA